MTIAKLVVTGILVAFATLHPWVAQAQVVSSSATLQVQATIRPYLRFSASQPASTYQVTAADIRRGHIDLPQSLTIRMQTNVRDEIRFDIASGGPERILVRTSGGLADAVRLASLQPSLPMNRVLDMRIMLPAEAREGIYPLQVALMPVAY